MNNLTNEIKSTLLSYYKFFMHALLVGTEIETNKGIADIIVLCRKSSYIYEIEIKISVSDLKNELKKDKHKFPYKTKMFDSGPNKYYFCVPTNILEETIQLANELNPKYGVLEYKPSLHYKDRINIIKQASLLHKDVYNYKDRIMQRINNDLCRRYQMLYPVHG